MTAAVIAAAFAALYAGHAVGDHIAQTDHQAAHKTGKGWPAAVAMFGHVATYSLCQALAIVGLVLAGVPLSPLGVFLGMAFSAGSHAFIDRRWPVQWVLRRTGSASFAGLASHGLNGAYLADQALHVGCLYVSALLIGGLS